MWGTVCDDGFTDVFLVLGIATIIFFTFAIIIPIYHHKLAF